MGRATPSVYAPESGRYLNATVTWESGPYVTVIVSSTSSWKLVPRGSSNHSGVLRHDYATDSYSGTFEATNGGQYVFQIYDPEEEVYYNNSFAVSGFTVDFNSDGGSGSSGDDTDSGYVVDTSVYTEDTYFGSQCC